MVGLLHCINALCRLGVHTFVVTISFIVQVSEINPGHFHSTWYCVDGLRKFRYDISFHSDLWRRSIITDTGRLLVARWTLNQLFKVYMLIRHRRHIANQYIFKTVVITILITNMEDKRRRRKNRDPSEINFEQNCDVQPLWNYLPISDRFRQPSASLDDKERLSTWTYARYSLYEKCPVAEPTCWVKTCSPVTRRPQQSASETTVQLETPEIIKVNRVPLKTSYFEETP